MFLERRTFFVKPDCMNDAVRMLKAEIGRVHSPMRVYQAVYGPFDVLIADTPGESQEAIDK